MICRIKMSASLYFYEFLMQNSCFYSFVSFLIEGVQIITPFLSVMLLRKNIEHIFLPLEFHTSQSEHHRHI